MLKVKYNFNKGFKNYAINSFPMKRTTFILLSFLISFSAFAQDISGSWNGLLKVQGQQLRLVINIQQAENGFKATMDSPDQEQREFRSIW